MRFKGLPKQVIPLLVLFAIVISGLVIARQFLVPESFGKYGHYRANAVDDIAALPISYSGYKACIDCHDDIYATKQASNHSGLSCETCHGPCQDHVSDPTEFIPTAPRDRGYCILCHGYNPSRPSGFPQILPDRHNPGEACMSCHQPHNPELPYPPEQCSACHREIATRKMVSHHSSVACTVCHTVPEAHWENPRQVRATKPTSVQTCGQCHSVNADSPSRIPRIDLDVHGKPYLCWDCHYPHFPEAN